MMIVKLDDGTFNVYDVLGDLGIWNFEREGLEQYLHLLKSSRSRSSGVKGFPLMESLYGVNASGPVQESLDDDPLFKEALEEGLPLKCYFDTDIVLRNADQWGPGIISPPSLSIDVNNLCNFACRWCCVDIPSRSSKNLLSPEELTERIIRPLAEAGNLDEGAGADGEAHAGRGGAASGRGRLRAHLPGVREPGHPRVPQIVLHRLHGRG
ncbi:MAG: hypothetical protein HGA78_12095, partial [Nitrospirales bacterium]|nr:hypothetical protein [Nitrospirales bacterium]